MEQTAPAQQQAGGVLTRMGPVQADSSRRAHRTIKVAPAPARAGFDGAA